MVLSTLKKTAKEFFVWFWILIFCTVVGFVQIWPRHGLPTAIRALMKK